MKPIEIEAKLIRQPLATRREVGDDNWRETSYQWRITLRCEGREMGLDYYTGAGLVDWKTPWKGPPRTVEQREYCDRAPNCKRPRLPTLGDVLSCLHLDASALDTDFESWAGDLGYNSDSRKALAIFLECQKQGKELRKLLGADWREFMDMDPDEVEKLGEGGAK